MENRPILKLPRTRVEIWHDVIAILILIGMISYLFSVWHLLPDKFPIHFDAHGKVNGWGGKTSLFPSLLIAVFVYSGLTILSKYPHIFNYLGEITAQNAHRKYLLARMTISWLKFSIVALFGYIDWCSIQLAFGHRQALGLWIVPIILVVFGGIIFVTIRAFLKD